MRINYYAISSVIFLIFGLIALQFYFNEKQKSEIFKFVDPTQVQIKAEECLQNEIEYNSVKTAHTDNVNVIEQTYQRIAQGEFEARRKNGGQELEKDYAILADLEAQATGLERKSKQLKLNSTGCTWMK
jgi:hypothetical protein